ncbi:Prefoldin alpha domain containing protein [Aphelenchoides besseyi]|nr:Prefoldin alpha domain containing protein [Aphelenchoides besseyi]
MNIPNSAKEMEHVGTWLRYLQSDEESCKKAIEEKKRELEEYDQLKAKVSDLTKRLEKSVFIPVSKMAFIPGTLDHTNEFYTMIGDNTFVKKSSYRTVELLNRRTDLIKTDIKEMEEQLKLVEQRIEFAEQLTFSSNEIEIREPYDETKETPASKRRKHDVSVHEYKEMMSRLDELEQEENENDELNQPVELTTTEVDTEEDKSFNEEIDIENMQTPKGVPRKDFERLLRYMNTQDVENSNSDEDETDSDDRSCSSASEEEQQSDLIEVQEVELQKPKLKILSNISPSVEPSVVSQSSVQPTTKQTPPRRKSVQFNDSPLGPVTSSSTATETPHSILRQTDHVPRVDWQAVEAMNRRDQKLILPESKDAIVGMIVERDPLAVLPERPNEEPNKKVSKFKKERTAN